jgi:polysaccharide export outer membrane protein
VKKVSFYLLAAVLLLSSCKAYQKTVYLQNSGTPASYNDSASILTPDPVIKNGDLLTITVNSLTPEAAAPFNLPLIPGGEAMKSYAIGGNASIGGSVALQNYLVDPQGNIQFPILGTLHIAGKKKSEVTELIKSKIYPAYLKEEPIIYVRFSDFKISVLGEVARPGVIPVNNEKISILEAIAQAGDLTIYGQRNNILLIRETEKGQRQTVRINLLDKRLVDSPYYYLQQNDVLYIQPNGSKSRNFFVGNTETLAVSVVGTLISLTYLIVAFTK